MSKRIINAKIQIYKTQKAGEWAFGLYGTDADDSEMPEYFEELMFRSFEAALVHARARCEHFGIDENKISLGWWTYPSRVEV